MSQIETLRKILNDYIGPILGATEISQPITTSRNSEMIAIQAGGQRLAFKYDKTAEEKLELQRAQLFKSSDSRLITPIFNELITHYTEESSNYSQVIAKSAVEVGICKFLSPVNYNILHKIIDSLNNWSLRTYEGKNVSFTIGIKLSDTTLPTRINPNIIEVLNTDFSALISNSFDSVVIVSANGAIIEHKEIHTFNNHSKVPFRFLGISSEAIEKTIIVTLTNVGEILIFQNESLIFSKRRGLWNYFDHESIIKKIEGGNSSKGVREAIYETIIDVSFSRSGGGLAFIRTSEISNLQKKDVVKNVDLISNESLKSNTIRAIIQNRKFQELGRSLRKELLGIDGATIIDYSGNIIAVGAIIQIGSGSSGGGRLAAAKTLANYGTSIKISADGMIKGFYGSGKSNPIEIFAFG